MLRKNHKLKRDHFSTILKKGKNTHTKHLSIKTLPVHTWENAAFSVVVSKKVAKTAVLRNHTKRRLYNCVKHMLQKAKKPTQGVVIVKKDVSSTSFSDLKAEVESVL